MLNRCVWLRSLLLSSLGSWPCATTLYFYKSSTRGLFRFSIHNAAFLPLLHCVFFFSFELSFQATSVKAMCGFESDYVAGKATNISSRMECFHVDMRIY